MKTSKTIVEDYLNKSDWRVYENSNSPYSFGGLNKHIIAEVSKDYWLRYVYDDEIANSYLNGEINLHDLGGLSLYCCGYSLKEILLKGVKGIPNVSVSTPAKHFDAIINQIANLTTIYQNEQMGAVAFNSFDTMIAPFIREDNLSYDEVKQALQNFIFSINSNSRAGAEPAFTNITLDITPSDDLLDEPVIIGGKFHFDKKYGDYQNEIDMVNQAFSELMLEGDGESRPFAYPIPTYNIHKRFDWENPKADSIFEMGGKYGYPYFTNFINSDMEPSQLRSMCCHLQLDLRELKKRNGGLFGSGDSTGSIGVVTIGLPRIAYESKGNKDLFYEILEKRLVIAKTSLEIKRKWLQENILDKHLIHAYMEYVGTMDNHFSTIGIVGMNEMCENFYGEGIGVLSEEGKNFCLDVGEFIRIKLVEFQKETGNLYNFEATPAESTCYSLALKDKKLYPDIITRGTPEAPYYTNSCHIPVSQVKGLKQIFDNQDELQIMFTGGTVIHLYMDGAISKEQAKKIVKTVCENYRVPYISISPLNRYCKEHGYVDTKELICPICGDELELYQRITGYLRKVENFNVGKKSEFYERNQLDSNKI